LSVVTDNMANRFKEVGGGGDGHGISPGTTVVSFDVGRLNPFPASLRPLPARRLFARTAMS
jgi:hypothetical protein